MAISPVRLDNPAANTSTRRTLLTAIAAVPLLALPLVPATAGIAANAMEWDRALTAWRTADAAADRHYKTVYLAVYAKLDRIAPYRGFTITKAARDGTAAKFSFDPNLPIADQFPFFDRQAIQQATELMSAHRHRCDMSRQLCIDDIAVENDRLTEEAVQREAALLTMPAPNREALLWKLEHLFRDTTRGRHRESDTIIGTWCDAFMADARRLLGT